MKDYENQSEELKSTGEEYCHGEDEMSREHVCTDCATRDKWSLMTCHSFYHSYLMVLEEYSGKNVTSKSFIWG